MLWSSLGVVSFVMLLGWLYQCVSRNAGVVDVLWSLSLSLLAIGYGITGSGSVELRWLAGLVMGLWYLRLTVYLALRVFGSPEEGRYRYLRQYWGKRALFYHFFFFQFQAVLAWAFSLPAWVIAQGNIQQLGWNHYFAIGFALVCLIGVTTADNQLARFKNTSGNKDQVCEQGWWYYSRHPNYFFEWLHWFSYPLLAIGLTYGAWLWLSPGVMLLFLYFITGIPYTEQQALRSRGALYKRYQQTTSAFVPWRKKHVAD